MRKVALTMSVLLFVLALSPFALTMYQIQTASAADGANGTLEVSANQVFKDTTVTIHMEGLDASSDYTVDFTTGCSSQINFTTSAAEDSKDFTVKLSAPSSGEICSITLEAQSTGTAIDQVDVRIRDGEDLVPSDFILSVMAPLLILIIVAALVGNFVRGAQGK
ncbi:MAG: hypothetical protein ACXADY_26870 [Candidatus Hodarchaeales archaeon]|jgi:hypothetical protein